MVPPIPAGPFCVWGPVSPPSHLQALLDPSSLPIREWGLTGVLAQPMMKASLGQPKRQLAGFATTYAVVDADGNLHESWDRDGQVMEAAKAANMIDWSMYLRGGMWNDTHIAPLPNGAMPRVYQGRDPVYVGVPQGLEFCAPGSEMAKAHRKVGWFTWGHLFDRRDPDSWRRHTEHYPSPDELDRSDYFWDTADLLKDTGRTLGFSMHGLMATSPCGTRIIWAKSNGLAVCELPSNPASTAEARELLKAQLGERPSLEQALGRAKPDRSPCGRCSCPPGVCGVQLRKASPASAKRQQKADFAERRDAIVQAMIDRFGLDEATAVRVFDLYLAQSDEE